MSEPKRARGAKAANASKTKSDSKTANSAKTKATQGAKSDAKAANAKATQGASGGKKASPAKGGAVAPAKKEKAVNEGSAAPSEEWSPSKGALVVSRLQAKWGTLSEAERAVLDSLSSPAQRAELGGKTRARGVAQEAVRWAVSLDRQLREYEVLRQHYHPKRFAYYLERVDALIALLGKEGGRGSAKGATKGQADAALQGAKRARARLLAAMGRFAGSRKGEWTSIDEAQGRSLNDEDVAASIQRLVALATGWRGQAEGFLLTVTGLTEGVIEDARRAANALTEAGAAATEAGPAPARDSPAVNVLEGWVLEEMKRAMEDVEAAREESPVIERLVAGVATRVVLGGRPRKSAKAPGKPEGAAPEKEGAGEK